MKLTKRCSVIMSLVLVFSLIFSTIASAGVVYEVKEGDVLWKIAEKHDTTWQEVSRYNNLENPNLIFPGDKLTIEDHLEEGDEVTIALLETADLHGRIYAYEYAIDSVDADAGVAKIATLIKKERAKYENVILMDAGDTVQDNSAELFNDMEVHPMIDALNFLNYDVWTLGNHEYNFEKEFIDRNVAAFKGDVLAANIYEEDGSRYTNPYTIIKKDGVRVAIIGLIPPHVPIWEASAPSHYAGLTFTDPLTEAKKVVAELDGKYDVLVGNLHLGRTDERDATAVYDIAEAIPEFDIIFGGHEHATYVEEVNGVTIIEPGRYGANLAKAEIVATKTAKGFDVDVTAENIYTKYVEEDKEILDRFKYVHEQSMADANTVVGNVSEDFVKRVDYITGEAKVTTMPTTQLEDTALIDLINEVQMFYAKSQISSAAAFKSDMNLVAGEFMKKDVANIYKYPNTLMGVNITGANLKDYMEWSAGYFNTHEKGDVTISFNPKVRGYNFDMFAGVTYDIDISKPAGERIVNLTFMGEPIDDMKTYKLAVNNYRFGTLTNHGWVTADDVYFDSYEMYQDAGRIRDLIIQYIAEEKEGIATPSVDHNWKLIGYDLQHKNAEAIYEKIRAGTIEIPRSEDGRTPNVKSIKGDDYDE